VIQSVWEDFLIIVREELGSRVVETWFKAVTLMRWDALENIVYLQTPNAFICNWLEKNYRSIFQSHLGRLLNVVSPKIVFMTLQQKKNNAIPVLEGQVDNRNASAPMYRPAHALSHYNKNELTLSRNGEYRGTLNQEYNFEKFVVGPSNSLAYAAARTIAQKPGNVYNPLFIYGKSGLGKTHLLHAIGNEIQSSNKNAVVLYQTADRFVSEFIHAIRFDKIHRFQKKYQAVDVLLVDDIQFISNKDTTQEAFFHIFNSLYDAKKQLVFSSDTFPQNINGIAERLRSRLAAGMVADIHQPCMEVKTAILKKKAEESGEVLSDEVASFLALHVTSNIRELEGALIRVLAFSHLTKQTITLELVQKVISSTGDKKSEAIGFKAVVKSIEKHFAYSLEELRSKNRNKDLTLVRQITMYIMKQSTDKSLREIGSYLGGRNHATVKHALAKIETMRVTNNTVSQHIESILKEYNC